MHIICMYLHIFVVVCSESVELHTLRKHQAILLQNDTIVHDVRGRGILCDNEHEMIWGGEERCHVSLVGKQMQAPYLMISDIKRVLLFMINCKSGFVACFSCRES